MPLINPGEYGADLQFTETFSDTFSGTGGGAGANWRYVDLVNDALHRAGNEGLDANGNIQSGSVPGKRWSAFYELDQSDIVTRDGNGLLMGGKVVAEPDPTRQQYTQNGQQVRFDQNKFYASWIETWSRVYSNEANGGAGGHITDPNSPNLTWSPGTYSEMEFDFSEVKTQGFRISWWLLPAYDNASNAYDSSPANGVEIDIFELEATDGVEDTMQIKVIAGAGGGNTPNGGINIPGVKTGKHKIGLLWLSDILVWYVDGVEVQRDTERVPNVPHYMVISREINSGAKNNPGAGELQANPPYVPVDVGLYAKNVWFERANIATDVARIHYVKVYDIGGVATETVAQQGTQSIYLDLLAETTSTSFTATAKLPPKSDGTVGDASEYTFAWTASTGTVILSDATKQTIHGTFASLPEGSTADRRVECDINEVA